MVDAQQTLDRACCWYGTCSAHPAQVLWDCLGQGHRPVCARVVLISQLVFAHGAALVLLLPGKGTASGCDWQLVVLQILFSPLSSLLLKGCEEFVLFYF